MLFLLLACQLCPGGMYCPFYNATAPHGKCAEGYFCQEGSNTDKPSGNNTGVAGPCTDGHFCQKNTTHPIQCPVGSYGNSTFMKSADDCILCDLGRYCATTGLLKPSGKCDPGYYCLRGSPVRNPSTVMPYGGPCPARHYCDIGTSLPHVCEPGTYNNETGRAHCYDCCPGYYCPRNTIACLHECPAGHYCPIGTGQPYSYPCPHGTYNNKTGRTSINDCLPCDPGMYCPHAGASHPHENCSEGWYCLKGSWTNKPMGFGVVLGNTSHGNFSSLCHGNSTGGQCNLGQFCGAGAAIPQPCTSGIV